MARSLAPIVLFTYARPEHTRRTIEALQKNTLASDSELYIYSDSAKNEKSAVAVAEVRSYLRTVTGFGRIEIIERERNWGLADSIVNGVTTLVERHGKVIVLEDDIVTSPHFLTYMNAALTLYADMPQVMHVSGYFFPLTDTEAATLPPTFFYNQTSCWGWGTWGRAWKHYRSDAATLLGDIQTAGRLREFDMDGQFRFSSTLRANAEGRQKTWAVKWHASVFLKGGLCLHPCFSLTQNIGHDGSGTHGKHDARYFDPHFSAATHVTLEQGALQENTTARAIATRFLARLRPSLFTRFYTLLKRSLSL